MAYTMSWDTPQEALDAWNTLNESQAGIPPNVYVDGQELTHADLQGLAGQPVAPVISPNILQATDTGDSCE